MCREPGAYRIRSMHLHVLLVGTVLVFEILATSRVIWRNGPNCDSAHSYKLYSAAPLADQARSIITGCPNEWNVPRTEATNYACSILIMPSAWLRSRVWTSISHSLDSNIGSNSPIHQNGKQTLKSIGYPVYYDVSSWLAVYWIMALPCRYSKMEVVSKYYCNMNKV